MIPARNIKAEWTQDIYLIQDFFQCECPDWCRSGLRGARLGLPPRVRRVQVQQGGCNLKGPRHRMAEHHHKQQTETTNDNFVHTTHTNDREHHHFSSSPSLPFSLFFLVRGLVESGFSTAATDSSGTCSVTSLARFALGSIPASICWRRPIRYCPSGAPIKRMPTTIHRSISIRMGSSSSCGELEQTSN